MRKTFTISGEKTFNAEGISKADIMLRYGIDDPRSIRGPRFTDSLRSKPRKGLDNSALGQVAFLGTRAAVRNLARM